MVDVPPGFVAQAYEPPLTFTPASSGTGFGTSIATVDGNVAVGAPQGDGGAGAVELYDGVPDDDAESTTYNYGQLILPNPLLTDSFQDPAATPGDEFGAAVAVRRQRPPGRGARRERGRRRRFTSSTPIRSARLSGSDWRLFTIRSRIRAAAFGSAIASDGTDIAIGAPGDAGGHGAVYLFTGQTTSPSFGDFLYDGQQPRWKRRQ